MQHLAILLRAFHCNSSVIYCVNNYFCISFWKFLLFPFIFNFFTSFCLLQQLLNLYDQVGRILVLAIKCSICITNFNTYSVYFYSFKAMSIFRFVIVLVSPIFTFYFINFPPVIIYILFIYLLDNFSKYYATCY